jgi:hypothetical protein
MHVCPHKSPAGWLLQKGKLTPTKAGPYFSGRPLGCLANQAGLEDIRNFSPPKFEESKAQIRQGLLLKQRNEFVNKLMSEARIQVRE